MYFIDTEIERNDELTSSKLARRILLHFRLQLSQEKVRRLWQKLGWVQTGTKYCQLIREPNRVKQLEFSEKCLQENKQFDNVIYTDKCSVLLENHTKLSFHLKWEQPKLKPKDPVKVHVWAGISKRGPTELMVFEGIMYVQFYVSEILSNGLLPFICRTFPDGHQFQQDNDPKHTNHLARNFMEDNGINWWKTPPESPDLNPIKMLWQELKHFLQNIAKPRAKEELINGVERFSNQRVDAEKCMKYMYIGHLHSLASSCRAAGKSFQKLVPGCTLQTLIKTASNKNHDQHCPMHVIPWTPIPIVFTTKLHTVFEDSIL